MANDKPNQPQDESRRRFLKYSGTALGGVVLGGVIGGLVGSNLNKTTEEETPAPAAKQPAADAKDYNQALMFFNQDQFLTAEAAAERLFPKDDLGPGAKELGVAFFIDHQMASAFGTNSRDYMQPPYYKAEATQGYQLVFKRRELIALGLDAMNKYSTAKYKKLFVEIAPEEQDAVLTAFETDKTEIKDVPASNFFAMFLNLTLEGAYADPLYGGNRNMAGWKMRNFPGNQMSYTEYIEKEEFVKLEPLSLHDHLELG
ncbi:gluconate 2-dehydrogenase subunit 3 family protein [Paenibacillus glycanilyticus]|uniref:gluconate 2-dehydrogenase subunit 3 family protein n=1 Tax=Paenibacillus glycanilyticus TaxID=126569 RepID=UPI00203AD823|nr:gluconate 2-dehydrogenase subunit 3 family protein [Paenibacillus glycanilyticus]MCM3628525.1 gluconate 2-dehydrogenase subunit 3 family protein [Paenibacillus glycanilyticus]